MNDKPFLGFELLKQSYRFINRKVRNVFFLAQSIDNQVTATLNLVFLLFRDAVGIGNIGKIMNAESQYRS